MTYVLVPQLDGSTYAGLNCNAAVTASQVRFATNNAKEPDAADIRAHTKNPNGTPDTSGGTNLSQMAAAAEVFGVSLSVQYWADFEEAWALLQRGDKAVNVSIWYGVLHGTVHDACPTFTGNHAIGGSNGKIGDPLADGRKPGIPNGMAVWSHDLLREAAGDLNVSESGGYQRLGAGKVFMSVADAPKVPEPVPAPTPDPKTKYRYGGQARSRGDYRVKPGIGVAFVRSTPNNTGRPVGTIPAGIIVKRLLNGTKLPFHIAQTTYSGASVGGDRRWHGDATGTLWIHHSLVEPV